MYVRIRLLPILLPALALLPGGCGDRGYTFSTMATYDVSALGFRADIIATGKVPPGADLADQSFMRILLTRLGNPDESVATLLITNPVVTMTSGQTITGAISTNRPVTLPWGSLESEVSLKTILTNCGFTNQATAAFTEAFNAISGPSLGPKSTGVASSAHVTVVKAKSTIQR